MDVIRAASIPLTPWPNGLGLARQMLAYPDPGNPLCQISMAEITADSAFSHFGGIDRITVPVCGNGLTLDVAGFGCLVADGTHAALRYPGDRPTTCRLTDGPMRVLNVMTVRGRATAEQTLERLTATLRLEPGDGAVFAWCLDGHMRTEDGQTIAGDEGVYADTPVVLRGDATLIVVQMRVTSA
jgi:uncharacterized protein